ncbi:IQ domain-containing protein N [Varanus komodoensis]|nr:IQ domain-containing protein N [Varanus komodoensis]
METYEDHPWCPYSGQSGEDEEDEDGEHRYDPHLARVQARAQDQARARSSSRSHRRSSFLVDELDMLMDKAATTIQASWRGFLVRRQIATENAAASTIQAAWRRFITREYLAMQRDQADRERATVVLQAHYRGYVVRRTLRECSRAATTIQAHWRGYCVRRAARGGPRRPELPRAYRGYPSYGPGSAAWVGPYPRKHWRKCLVGKPEEWAREVPRRPPSPQEQQPEESPPERACPQCGRCTSVRVLVGVGKGPLHSESEAEESDCEARAPRHPSARQRGESPARPYPSGHRVSYQVGPQSHATDARHAAAVEHSRRQGREPMGLSQRHAPPHASARPAREGHMARSFSSTSLQKQVVVSGETSEWLYENYCARRMGEGQRRVFKTRKHVWHVARAATIIQSFWRGWKARKALRLQQEAATKIQSAYRGYKTRLFLIEAGVLSEGDTE